MIDIGILSYKNPNKLRRCVDKLTQLAANKDFNIFIVDNPAESSVRGVIEELANEDKRISFKFLDKNVGYAGGVNEILRWSCSRPSPDGPGLKTPYLAFFDNDAYVSSPAWDVLMSNLLDNNPEIGFVVPNGGAYLMHNGHYNEVLWGVGFCWMTRREVITQVGWFDENLGHQEEVDFQMRVRLAGFKLAANPSVNVSHDATSTNDPASQERINKGVVNWVNKWVKYFCGADMSYHSPNVLRHEDWPPSALYLERFFIHQLPVLNMDPEVVNIDGVEYDLIRKPKLKWYYRGRVI